MLGIENIIGKGRRPSVEVLVETETSAMETLPSRWTYVRDDYAKKETNKTGIKKTWCHSRKTPSISLCSVLYPEQLLHTYETASRTVLSRTAGYYNPCHGRSKCSAKTTPPAIVRPPTVSPPPHYLATRRSFFTQQMQREGPVFSRSTNSC